VFACIEHVTEIAAARPRLERDKALPAEVGEQLSPDPEI
jgi:hypothetical protein